MSASRQNPPNLLTHWEAVLPRLRASERVALFLDFDGTLVPIAPRPDEVRLTPSTRRLLDRLARRSRVLVTVISGRRRRELLQYIAVKNIRYFGLYGWERSNGLRLPRSEQSALRRAAAILREDLAEFPGVWIEDKESTLSLHFAAARPVVATAARERISFLLRPFRRRLRLFENIRDVEVMPCAISDKGSALRRCLASHEFHRALPIYFGDDYSDEPAFAAARDGVPIIVGNRRPTRARYRLRSPDEVADALDRLAAAVA